MSSCAKDVLDKIKWSDDDYDLKEFVEKFGDFLPILCQTTSGYAGCDDDIHQVAADEIYWISSIQRQTRIVGKDKKKRFISISVDDCPFKFQVIEEDDKKGSLVTSADLFTSFRQNPSIRIRFQFEKDHVVSYQLGADSGYETRFGIMELKEYYEEKYLLGYGMNNGFLYVRTIGIPVYMDVSLSRAMGFESETDEGMTFRRWTDELRKLVDLQEKPSIKIANAVIVFLERPTDGDYECVHASKLIHNNNNNNRKQPDNNNTTQTDNKTENEYAYIRFLEPTTTTEPNLGTTSYYNTGRFLEPTTTTKADLETTSSMNTGRDMERRRSRMEEIIRVPLPPIPRRPPPVPSELAMSTPPYERPPAPLPTARAPLPTARASDDRPPAIPSRKHPSWPKTKEQKRSQTLSIENHPIYQEGRSYKEGDPPRIPPNPPPPTHQPLSYEVTIPGKFPTESYTSLVNLNSDHPSKIDPTDCSTHDPSEMDSPEIYDTSGFLSRNRIEDDSPDFDDSPPPIPPLPLKWTRPVAKTTKAAVVAVATTPDDVTIGVSRMASYVTASEVPRDEDVENWTVSDVTEALRLLKMSKHEDQFKEREIDGALLCSLDERTLVEDFGFKLFEATKVFMFARKGWRPK